jgi:hypothetical protein
VSGAGAQVRLADIPRDPYWSTGSHRDDPVRYLNEWPDVLPGGEFVINPSCPICTQGHLALETDKNGYGDFYTCFGGCGGRFFVEIN